MTQPEEQQSKGQQPADEPTTPVGAAPSSGGADSEPTAAFDATSDATSDADSQATSPISPQTPPAAPQSPPAHPVWGQPPASPAAPGSPAAPSVWSVPPADPTVPQSPAAPSVWGQPPASPASPAAPGSPGSPVAPSGPGWTPPAGTAQPGVPLPPGWGQQTQPGQPGQGPYQPPVDPFHTTTMTPASAQLPYNPYGQLGPDGQPVPPPGFTPDQLQPPPKKKSKALLITSIVLGVVVLLCAVGGVGAFFLINNSEGQGAETAKDAAQEFLTAVYKEHDGVAAEKLVCNEARDREAIDAKIKEIQDQKTTLKSPSITWDSPKIENETAEKADTTVTIKLTTSDEKLAEQTLKLTLVKHDGWFVCEVQEQKK